LGSARQKRHKKTHLGRVEPLQFSPEVQAASQEPSLADKPLQSVPIDSDQSGVSTTVGGTQSHAGPYSLFSGMYLGGPEESSILWDFRGQSWETQVLSAR